MKKIADGDDWTMPATVEDAAVFEEIAEVLKARGLPG
jgi:propionyl-CoA synthetase